MKIKDQEVAQQSIVLNAASCKDQSIVNRNNCRIRTMTKNHNYFYNYKLGQSSNRNLLLSFRYNTNNSCTFNSCHSHNTNTDLTYQLKFRMKSVLWLDLMVLLIHQKLVFLMQVMMLIYFKLSFIKEHRSNKVSQYWQIEYYHMQTYSLLGSKQSLLN